MPQIAQEALQVAETKSEPDTSFKTAQAESVVFTGRKSYGSLYMPQQNLVANPLSLIMLGQMELPIGNKSENM